jgi:hypothetical protein
MNAPRPVIVLIEVPGDRGVWKKSLHRHHKAIRHPEPHRPPQPIPERDVERLRRLAEQFRDAVRVQHDAVLEAGRTTLRALRLQAA